VRLIASASVYRQLATTAAQIIKWCGSLLLKHETLMVMLLLGFFDDHLRWLLLINFALFNYAYRTITLILILILLILKMN